MGEQWVRAQLPQAAVAAFPLPTAPHIRLGRQAHAIDVNSLDGGETRFSGSSEGGPAPDEPGSRRAVASRGPESELRRYAQKGPRPAEEGRSLMSERIVADSKAVDGIVQNYGSWAPRLQRALVEAMKDLHADGRYADAVKGARVELVLRVEAGR
jgi:hypothetical protein